VSVVVVVPTSEGMVLSARILEGSSSWQRVNSESNYSLFILINTKEKDSFHRSFLNAPFILAGH